MWRALLLAALASCGRLRFDAIDTHDADASAACTASAATDWLASPVPNDPGSGLPNLASYTVGADQATVTDDVTGLVWQRELAPGTYTWDEARAYCEDLVLGACDWRLPTRIELTSIVSYARASPAIDPVAFPDTPNADVWSATPSIPVAMGAWVISMGNGFTSATAATDAELVRCVRGGSRGSAVRYQATPDTIVDLATGLAWQRVIDGGLRTQDEATQYCASLPIAGGGWRLPSIHELHSIVDTSRTAPALDPDAFTDGAFDGRSGTRIVGDPNLTWGISFTIGSSMTFIDATVHQVRCVR